MSLDFAPNARVVVSARAALAVCLALALIHTWPLGRAPSGLSLNAHADAALNTWIVSWIAHTLPVHPTQLFNGNIFAPEPATLAYSEPLLAPALLVAPVRWLGGSPVLAFNLLTIAGLALTAWSAWWVARRWTGSDAAALVTGSLAAFNVHVLTRLAHPAATHAWGVWLSWYFADAIVERPSRRTAVALALVVAATAVTSIYLLALAGLVVAAVIVVNLRRARAAAIVAGASIAGLAIASPILWPYARLAAAGTTRPIEMVAQFSASLAGYLASTSRLEAGWTHAFFTNDVNVFFAGVAALVLAAIGIGQAWRGGDASRRRLAAIGIVAAAGVLLSLGPSTAIYRGLYAWFLPLRGLRAAARFGYLFLSAVALLAGWGTAALVRRVAVRPAPAAAIIGVILVAVNVEVWQGPVPAHPFTGVPAIYSLLADAPDPVRLVEVPFYPPDAIFDNAEYVFNSTAHWRPLMNGYSGYTPDSYRARAESFWYFPEDWAIDAIEREGATHLMVHLSRFTPDEVRVIGRVLPTRSELQLIATDPMGDRLYRVTSRSATPGRSAANRLQ